MTEAQRKRFYFPAWRAACRANGWRLERGRLVADAARLGVEGRAVLNFAWQRASREHRAPGLDDLRHGAHLYALGCDKRSAELAHREVDRIVTLFRLLADPDDLGARLAWEAPERAERDGLVRYLQTLAPEAVIRAIARNAWDTTDWERRELSDLKWLVRTLKEKAARRARSAAGAIPAGTADRDGNVLRRVPPAEPPPDWTV